MTDEDMNAVFGCIKMDQGSTPPEDIEGRMPKKWKLRRGIVMDLHSSMDWDFSRMCNKNKVRE